MSLSVEAVTSSSKRVFRLCGVDEGEWSMRKCITEQNEQQTTVRAPIRADRIILSHLFKMRNMPIVDMNKPMMKEYRRSVTSSVSEASILSNWST